MNGQIYATVGELIADLHLNGDEPGLLDRIRAASRFVERRFGAFIPITETQIYRETGRYNLYIDYLLAVTQLKYAGAAQLDTQYTPAPAGGYWRNGPYTRIEKLSGAWCDDVEITGQWGLYSEIQGLGETVSQVLNATTITVADGSLLSPGMILKAGNEQEIVTGVSSATIATSLLDGVVDAGQEEITVDDGSEFHRGEVIQLSTEDCYIRMVRGNTLVVARGWNTTTKINHADDSAISVYRTYTVERGANGTTAAAHTDTVLNRYVAPEDVNWLVRQIAGLMRMKAASGFAGKTGNAELGETFYFNEFPGQVKEIKRNYRITRL